MAKKKKPAKKARPAEVKLLEQLTKSRQNAFNRFPLLFTLLAAFGVVITYNGMRGMIEHVNWLNQNPIITFSVGVLILLLTGTLYKKL